MQVSEFADGGFHQPLRAMPVTDAVSISHGLPARGYDFGNHILRRTIVRARSPNVIYHHTRTLGRKQQGVLAAETAPGASHNRHSSIQNTHKPAPIHSIVSLN
ncbi:hypothetical protein StoSoilB13_04200 [Arthrobacter sp. StoSoilB13]|nr:hypothetical protein StoSoilB13_04200 [Arthrobacter sp. StoSoilB13]